MKENQNIISLNSKEVPGISEVGGKGYSLIKLSSINLNVPPGIILTVNFFSSWTEKIKKLELYIQFLSLLQNDKNSTSKECSSILNKIKEWCLNNLSLSEDWYLEKISEFISILAKSFCKYLTITFLFTAKFELFFKNDKISGIFF